MGSLKCPDCGGKITEDEQYCPNCGTNLEAPIQKSTENALEYFNKAQKKYDQNTNLDSALLDCELALVYNPEFAEAYNLYGLILDAQRKTAKAVESYRKALELNPNLMEAKANLRDAEIEQFESRNVEYPTLPPPTTINFREILSAMRWVLLLLIIFAVTPSLIKAGLQHFGPKTTVVFEVDTSRITLVEKADLEATADILTERCHQLGYSMISFYVSEKNEIKSEIPTYLNPQKIVEEINMIGLLEFVDFGDNPQNEGVEIRTHLNSKFFSNIQSPTFHTIMSNEGINTSSIIEDQVKGYAISFALTDEGSKIFSDFTSTHKGQYLGIVLDTIVISSPLINEPITGGQAMISGNFTKEEANHLSLILQTKPLPIAIKIKQISDN